MNKSKGGFLYCFHNEIYKYYGVNVYKLGCSNNIKRRINAYCTPYIEETTIIHTTNKIRNKFLAELILFEKLSIYRMNKNREFFKCDPDIIKKTMNDVEEMFNNYSDDEIYALPLFINKLNMNKITINEIILATNIDFNNYCQLLNKENDNLTKSERAMIEKFQYSYTFNKSIDDIDQTFLKLHYGKLNIAKNNNELMDYIINDCPQEMNNDYKFKYKKMEYIKKIINNLGFDGINTKVFKENFDKNINEMIKIMDNEFMITFNIKKEKIDEISKHHHTNKKILGFINSLFNDYAIQIKANKKSKRENKKVIRCIINSYSLNNHIIIDNIKQ